MASRGALSLILVAIMAGPAPARPEEHVGGLPTIDFIDGHPVRTVLLPDTIVAINHPATACAADASLMEDDDLVIGVVAGGQARAYPIAELDWHEVVNDELGGQAIAVTW